MFRNPRPPPDSSVLTPTRPSVGRAPTPPLSGGSFVATAVSPPMASPETAQAPTPQGQAQTLPKGGGWGRFSVPAKRKPKQNGSILSFFRKINRQSNATSLLKDGTNDGGADDEESLFFADQSSENSTNGFGLSFRSENASDEDGLRFNEAEASVKRRRLSETAAPPDDDSGWAIFETRVPEPQLSSVAEIAIQPEEIENIADEDIQELPGARDVEVEDSKETVSFDMISNPDEIPIVGGERISTDTNNSNILCAPSLLRESISIMGGDGFEGMEDFIDDFPEEGEEYVERIWMENQREFDNLEDNIIDEAPVYMEAPDEVEFPTSEKEAEQCPICNASLAGISSEQASIHVNRCLDGDPIPSTNTQVENNAVPSLNHNRFQRAAIARPGQKNPFENLPASPAGSSAFTKLMSSNAEDAAWAAAAANETASRGKQAYERTCPFYKILPGFFICVDAFRYGAVKGCNAYFLSHFHSDHYIGLTSSWRHGPIYCSRVTANLVTRQLRVDPQWVVGLEFEEKVEVPGTEGVHVTMIPANHCPGSSLFLYEKVVGKGKTPKVQRVLHCGDFRACPAHVQHPLLRPEVVDAVTGKQVGQQKLDVCYLDTTYLTPKYSFPNQADVIKACADMCVSLSKDQVDESDDWERSKKERGGSGMVKFIQRDVGSVELEQNEIDPGVAAANKGLTTKRRGRLLVVVGTYSIGKERICLGIARALNSKIYASPNKQKICAALEDDELMSLLTTNPLDAQVHMQMIMEIRPETLAEYLGQYATSFTRIVGFRPSGWNYRGPPSRSTAAPSVPAVLHGPEWRSRYGLADLVPQRGSSRRASCFGVPYSEHSSFRELTMFACALRIDRIIPTVNVGSARARERMMAWFEKWAVEKRRNGLFRVTDGAVDW